MGTGTIRPSLDDAVGTAASSAEREGNKRKNLQSVVQSGAGKHTLRFSGRSLNRSLSLLIYPHSVVS